MVRRRKLGRKLSKKQWALLILLVLFLLGRGWGEKAPSTPTDPSQAQPGQTASEEAGTEAPDPYLGEDADKNTEQDTDESSQEDSQENAEADSQADSQTDNQTDSQTGEKTENQDPAHLRILYVDLGQADASLIIQGDQVMLIDAGNNKDGGKICQMLKEEGIQKVDVLIGTHPHADHIGGLDDVIRTFDIGTFYMPEVIHTTRTFEEVLDAAEDKGLKITVPSPGDSRQLGKASYQFLAPQSESYEKLNDYSISLRVDFSDQAFLFTGDAERRSEKEMLASGLSLAADVFQAGHHGSSTSNTQAFLEAVDPDYLIVSAGLDNPYGHPHREIIAACQARQIKVYRTDRDGTITLTSSKDQLTISTEKP